MEKDHLEVLLEDIRSKFDLVLEGHEVLNNRIDDAFQKLDDKISLVDYKVGVLDDKIDRVESSLNDKIDRVQSSLNAKIDRVEKKVDAVADDLAAHRADTESHQGLYKVKE
jgi:outer membrane murein-binding lipoprotein Lpp